MEPNVCTLFQRADCIKSKKREPQASLSKQNSSAEQERLTQEQQVRLAARSYFAKQNPSLTLDQQKMLEWEEIGVRLWKRNQQLPADPHQCSRRCMNPNHLSVPSPPNPPSLKQSHLQWIRRFRIVCKISRIFPKKRKVRCPLTLEQRNEDLKQKMEEARKIRSCLTVEQRKEWEEKRKEEARAIHKHNQQSYSRAPLQETNDKSFPLHVQYGKEIEEKIKDSQRAVKNLLDHLSPTEDLSSSLTPKRS